MKSLLPLSRSHQKICLSTVKKTLPLWKALSRYHQYDVSGIENIPRKGRAMIVVNHSLATYDVLLLQTAIYKTLNRVPRPLVDHLFFKVPYLGPLAERLGAVEGNPENAGRLLRAGELLTIAPGGMKEALMPSDQKYQICWSERKGFARLAIETKTPVVIAVCPKADELYKIYPSYLSDFIYHKFKIPFFIARGLGPTLIPKPVPLKHHLSASIRPPRMIEDPVKREKQIERFHKKLVKTAEDLIQASISI
ncbi:MAG: lysophospholipid acyltransferase family protein [Oligoflexales bacterium]